MEIKKHPKIQKMSQERLEDKIELVANEVVGLNYELS
jgi:hypothetical protein